MSTGPRNPERARLEELLGTEATQGLSPAEAGELDSLLEAFPDEDPEALELAAAAVHLALLGPPGEMPAALSERLHLAAVAMQPQRASGRASAPASPRPAREGRPRTPLLAWAGWAVAASLLAVLVYTQWPKKPVGVPRPELTLAEKRNELKKVAPEFAGEKKAVAGNIVWSDQKQEGYLEVKGLPPIDAAAGTYQLWIVDGARKDSPPIDGGVFKVNPDGTALVPIKPPIQVKNAAAFAITRESEPGGVVVSGVKPENYELVLTKKG